MLQNNLFWLACTLNHIWACVQSCTCLKGKTFGAMLVRMNVLLPPCGQMWGLSSHNPDPTETHLIMAFITPWPVFKTLKEIVGNNLCSLGENTYGVKWPAVNPINDILSVPEQTILFIGLLFGFPFYFAYVFPRFVYDARDSAGHAMHLTF